MRTHSQGVLKQKEQTFGEMLGLVGDGTGLANIYSTNFFLFAFWGSHYVYDPSWPGFTMENQADLKLKISTCPCFCSAPPHPASTGFLRTLRARLLEFQWAC